MSTHPRTAIVTGAGSGIGLAVAERFISEGMNVVANGRTEAKLLRAAAKIPHDGRLAVVAGDITQPGTADRIVEDAVKRFLRRRDRRAA